MEKELQVTISKELLEKAGYKSWGKDYRYVRQWQKCIYEGSKKKYSINIREDSGWNPHVYNSESSHNFWPSIQFNIETSKGFRSINVELVQWFNESGKWSQITIEEMELMCEHIWTTLKGQYYEE